MKKSLRSILLALPLLAISLQANAQELNTVKVDASQAASALIKSSTLLKSNITKMDAPQFAGKSTKITRADATSVTLTTSVGGYYEAGETIADYYIILAEDEDATYDTSTGTVTATNSRVLTLDLYAEPTSPISLPAGTYTAGDGSAEFTYHTSYSFSIGFDENGSMESNAAAISGDITVVKNSDGTVTISATDELGISYTYTGSLKMTSSSTSGYAYSQITGNVEATFTGGVAYYYGNLYSSGTGNIYINLYDGTFEEESGSMTSVGTNFSLCAFSTLFGDPEQAKVRPGTYTMSRHFTSGTYYPGLEMTYAGITIPFGSYVKQRVAINSGDDYRYGYIVDGTVVITENDNGTYNFEINCVTDGGYTVKGTAANVSIPVYNLSDDTAKAIISNLEDDVELDLGYVTNGRLYHNGPINGVRRFTIDLGSPSGLDGNTEGDLQRIEFLADLSNAELPMGTYTVMEQDHTYSNFYAPYKLVQGYFYNGGLSGTRYMHYEEGRYRVMDLLAPAVEGTTTIQKNDDGTYTINMDFVDDAGYKITGSWTGTLLLQYDPTEVAAAIEAAGIEDVTTGSSLQIGSITDEAVVLNGVPAGAQVNVYSTDGRTNYTGVGTTTIATRSFAPGVYVIKVGNAQPIKFIKK